MQVGCNSELMNGCLDSVSVPDSLDGERLHCSVEAILDSFARSHRQLKPNSKSVALFKPRSLMNRALKGTAASALERGRQYLAKTNALKDFRPVAATPARWCDSATVSTMDFHTVYIEEDEDGSEYTEVTVSTSDKEGKAPMEVQMEREFSLFESFVTEVSTFVASPTQKCASHPQTAWESGCITTLNDSTTTSRLSDDEGSSTAMEVVADDEEGSSTEMDFVDDGEMPPTRYTEVPCKGFNDADAVTVTSDCSHLTQCFQSARMGEAATGVEAEGHEECSLYTEVTVRSPKVSSSETTLEVYTGKPTSLAAKQTLSSCPCSETRQDKRLHSGTRLSEEPLQKVIYQPSSAQSHGPLRRSRFDPTLLHTMETAHSTITSSQASRRPKEQHRSSQIDELTMDLLLQPRATKCPKAMRNSLCKESQIAAETVVWSKPTSFQTTTDAHLSERGSPSPANEPQAKARIIPDCPELIFVFPQMKEDASVVSALTNDLSRAYDARDRAILEAMSRPIVSQPHGYGWLSRFWGTSFSPIQG